VACGVVLPFGGIVFGANANWRGSEAERFSSTSLTMVSLSGVTHRGIGIGHGLMVSRRVEAQSAGMMEIMRIFILKASRWLGGCDGFCSVYTRCSLRFY
jgi:hypothetical protein